MMSILRMSRLQQLKSNWFLIGIVTAIVASKLYPNLGRKGGILKPELTVKFGAVFIIFLNSGLSVRSEELLKACSQYRIHIFIQVFTFAVFPIIGCALAVGNHAFEAAVHLTLLDPPLLEGLIVLTCLPPPVSSAVILTKAVGGNEAAAVFNSALGSFLGIFLTPLLILNLVGFEAGIPFTSVFSQLFITLAIPFFIGQLIRFYNKRSLERLKIPYGFIGSVLLLLIIYTTFCDTFSHDDLSVDSIRLFTMVPLIILLQCMLIYLVLYISMYKLRGYRPVDIVALMFCCTHKSLTLGIPIIQVVFSGYYDNASIVSIPLLIYHPTQILLGGLLVSSMKRWLSSSTRFSQIRGVADWV